MITLKQGFGRLIRSLEDRGVLVLLDPRIERQRYGKVFLESLPPYRLTRDIREVENFFSQGNASHEEDTETADPSASLGMTKVGGGASI